MLTSLALYLLSALPVAWSLLWGVSGVLAARTFRPQVAPIRRDG